MGVLEWNTSGSVLKEKYIRSSSKLHILGRQWKLWLYGKLLLWLAFAVHSRFSLEEMLKLSLITNEAINALSNLEPIIEIYRCKQILMPILELQEGNHPRPDDNFTPLEPHPASHDVSRQGTHDP
ncbi:hypothetical protein Peur_007638 [Populus x canadensis]